MNRDELFSALNGIKEEYLNEACSYELRQRQKRARILRMVFPAAALVAMLVLTTVVTLPLLTQQNPPLSSEPSSLSQEQPALPAPDVRPPEYSEGLVYEKREDHAVIVQLQGDGQVAHIPQFLDKLPVTKVELAEGTVPQNYTTISFNGEMLESLTLPKNQEMTLCIGQNVTSINPNALLNSSLVAVEVDQENAVYASYKGILYSKDLTVLIACPAGIQATRLTNSNGHEILNTEDTVQIPEKTIRIADRAFKNNTTLIDVTLPNGIVDIGRSAFENCTALRSLTLPISLESVSNDAFIGSANLGYLHYPGTKQNFLDLNVKLPIGCQVYYPLAESDPDLDIDPFIKFFTEAEECIAWFSRFNFIPCDWGSEVNGYYPVTMEGVSTLAELRSYLEKYFDKELLDELFEANASSDEPVFIEIDGVLHMMPADIPVAYTDGERRYSLTENEDGTILVTVRVNVPGTVANICVDTNYLIVSTENGYCFAEGFVLPVEKWYPLYLVNSQ